MKSNRTFQRLRNCESKSGVITFLFGWAFLEKNYDLLEQRCAFHSARRFIWALGCVAMIRMPSKKLYFRTSNSKRSREQPLIKPRCTALSKPSWWAQWTVAFCIPFPSILKRPTGRAVGLHLSSMQTGEFRACRVAQASVYLLPRPGGAPRRITQKSPSYWHGWSPDGKTLAYPGQRNGQFDIYTTSTEGGEEKQLTTAIGLDDGPEYTPDGKYIYFNSVRTGRMQIWRMHPDGGAQERVTSDDLNNWFPHISPDGKWLVFLSYGKEVEGHPENKDVMLRIVPLKDDTVDGKIGVLAKLFGGQGTINVPSWSPDSKQLAFVSYQLVHQENAAK